jgi:hypothetical protein
VYQQTPAPKGEKIRRFIAWAMKDGQKMADGMFYAPLPVGLVGRVETQLKEIH